MSGLDSLGADHDYFMQPLHILKDSLLQESNPSFCGKLAMFRTARQQLMNLMYMEKMRIQHPEIEQQEIKEPLIIVGLNRTGTTFLQNIMATDISNRSARYCEMIAPYGNNGDYCQKGLSNDPESWKHVRHTSSLYLRVPTVACTYVALAYISSLPTSYHTPCPCCITSCRILGLSLLKRCSTANWLSLKSG